MLSKLNKALLFTTFFVSVHRVWKMNILFTIALFLVCINYSNVEYRFRKSSVDRSVWPPIPGRGGGSFLLYCSLGSTAPGFVCPTLEEHLVLQHHMKTLVRTKSVDYVRFSLGETVPLATISWEIVKIKFSTNYAPHITVITPRI